MVGVVDGWRCEAPKLHKQTKKASSELAHARTRARARATHLGALGGVGVGVGEHHGMVTARVTCVAVRVQALRRPAQRRRPSTAAACSAAASVLGRHAGSRPASQREELTGLTIVAHLRALSCKRAVLAGGFPSFVSSCGR